MSSWLIFMYTVCECLIDELNSIWMYQASEIWIYSIQISKHTFDKSTCIKLSMYWYIVLTSIPKTISFQILALTILWLIKSQCLFRYNKNRKFERYISIQKQVQLICYHFRWFWRSDLLSSPRSNSEDFDN